MMIHDCIPCQYGDHDKHVPVPENPPEGVMGGWRCDCKGECRERKRERPVAAQTDEGYDDVVKQLERLSDAS